MNSKYQEITNYYFTNTDTIAQQPILQVKTSDNILLKQNLKTLKFCVGSLNIGNLYLPSFIAENVDYQSANFLNADSGATQTQTMHQTLTVDSLKYFVILRNTNNNVAYKVYLRHRPCEYTNVHPRPNDIQTGATYLQNRYYWYPNIRYFINVVLQQAINECMMLSSSGLSYTIQLVDDNNVQMTTTNTTGDYMLEFSTTLCRLFGFDIVTSFYYESSAVIANWLLNAEGVMSTPICPLYSRCLSYDAIILETDQNLQSENFVNIFNIFSKQKILFKFTPSDFDFFNKNKFTYASTCNENDLILWRFFDNDIRMSRDNVFNIKFYFVLHRNNEVYKLPYKLLPGENLEMSILFIAE